VDLCAQHEQALQEALSAFAPTKVTSKGTDPQAKAARERRDAIRVWGEANGIDIPSRGRISQAIQDQFDEAGGAAPAKRKRK
jgi:hypothetical protein